MSAMSSDDNVINKYLLSELVTSYPFIKIRNKSVLITMQLFLYRRAFSKDPWNLYMDLKNEDKIAQHVLLNAFKMKQVLIACQSSVSF